MLMAEMSVRYIEEQTFYNVSTRDIPFNNAPTKTITLNCRLIVKFSSSSSSKGISLFR